VDLNLQGNQLQSLPDGFLSTMPRLESLTITGNQVARLPKDLGRCEALQTLYAGANNLTDASPAFEPPCIIHAGLAHNAISQLPSTKTLSRAEAMISLDLTHNNLSSLPDALAKLAGANTRFLLSST